MLEYSDVLIKQEEHNDNEDGIESFEIKVTASPATSTRSTQDDIDQEIPNEEDGRLSPLSMKFEIYDDILRETLNADGHDERISFPFELDVRIPSTVLINLSQANWDSIVSVEKLEGYSQETDTWVCGRCSLTFKLIGSYMRHQETVHSHANDSQMAKESKSQSSSSSFKCEDCEATFTNRKKQLRHNREAHGKFLRRKCPLCFKIFATPEGLSSHGCRLESQLNSPTNSPSQLFSGSPIITEKPQPVVPLAYKPYNDEGRVPCNFCDMTFCDRSSAKRHMLRTHKAKIVCGQFVLPNERPAGVSHLAEEEERIPCPYCPSSCTTIDNVRKHIREKHPHKSTNFIPGVKTPSPMKPKSPSSSNQTFHVQRPHRCDKCAKYFSTSAALNKHLLRTHQKLLRFTCQYCGWKFFEQYSLKTHIERRHKDGVVDHDLMAKNAVRDWTLPTVSSKKIKFPSPQVRENNSVLNNSHHSPKTTKTCSDNMCSSFSSSEVTSSTAIVACAPNAFQQQLLDTLKTSLSTAAATFHLLQTVQPIQGPLPGNCEICHQQFSSLISHYLDYHQMYK